MRIGVVSDTHSLDVPKALIEDLRKVDLIIHAGDFCTLKDLKLFEKIKKTIGVRGNMDESPLTTKLPEDCILDLEGVKIGIFHGEGPAKNILTPVQERFKKKKVDVVIFGHSHQPLNQRIKNILYFNPGSPNDKVSTPYCSYGILTIDKGKAVGEIIKLED